MYPSGKVPVESLEADWLNPLSHSETTNQIFYRLLNEAATARGFLLVPATTLGARRAQCLKELYTKFDFLD